MKNTTILLFLLLLFPYAVFTQSSDSTKQKYLAELRAAGRNFTNYFNVDRDKVFALPEKKFVLKIDSLRKVFTTVLDNYRNNKNAESVFVTGQEKEIHYFFDKFLLDYPYFHEVATGKLVKPSTSLQQRLERNEEDFNNPALLANPDFKEYIRAFMHHQSDIELKKPIYNKKDNQRISSIYNLLPVYFINKECLNFWEYDYLYAYLDDWGVKNMERIVQTFNNSCTNTFYTNKVNALYREGMKARAGHLIKTYKSIDGFDLDIHLFFPENIKLTGKRPLFVYFSGGSWTKGSPEWAFSSCENQAKKGYVAASVEYRLADRQNTTPFEAVKDAKSAIRWLRQHADEYHIDTNRIVASGNSAGGHLILAAALTTNWNESTDDLRYSASPNLLLVNSGVYDFIGDKTTTWVSKGKSEAVVKQISPVHLVRKGLPPMLILHGTNDHSVPFESARLFDKLMKNTGNDYEFHALEGAPHEIWFDRRFSGTVARLRNEFLKKHGLE